MSSTPTLCVNGSTPTRKKSLKEKLFPHNHELKPKPIKKRAQSCDGHGKKHCILSTIHISDSDTSKEQRRSKLGIFIHETFEKISHTPPFRSSPHSSIPEEDTLTIIGKSHWRPKLHTIYKDPELLSVLIKFMQRSYNAKLILFIQSVHQLNTTIDTYNNEEKETETDTSIDKQIVSIFHDYIAPTAEYQVNLSYECFVNTTKYCHPQVLSTYTVDDKRKIFIEAVDEVETLMITSVLALFYDSNEFQVIAYDKSPNASPIIPPIVLSVSRSLMVTDSNVSADTDNEAMSADNDEFDDDELIFIDRVFHISGSQHCHL